ncbi:terminase TerL endonuclease subunit [Mycolicibacterium komossense]|uniref:Terminase n=1 Tax=Mycolicibacterium komossense TaxID=1779 RepID=A0ABT3C8P6_9MYCO|nr:terminase TerL endonuclease subunit [Mycolicibacterium komossense]MCV7225850.1 hypothetical protein [Mycolicibacterium komossense]
MTGNATMKVKDITAGPWFRWNFKGKGDPAERCIRFIETYCRSPKGVGHGKPLKLAEFQKSWIRDILKPGIRQAAFQAPRGAGKSTLLAAMAVWATFDKNPTGEPQVVIVAKSVGQAKKAIYNVALKMVKSEPELANRANIYKGIGDTRFVANDECGGGECSPIANDVDTLQGLDPSLAIVDEIGFQPVAVWNALVMASGKRTASLVVSIGTPGPDHRESALWSLREAHLDGRAPAGVSFTELSAPEGCDYRDEAMWRLANPAIDEGYLGIDALRNDVAMMIESEFRLYRLAQFVEGVDCWLGTNGDRVWSDLNSLDHRLVPGEPATVGIDVGLSSDTTAVVIGQYQPDGVLYTECKIWHPTADGTVDLADIMGYLRELDRTYRLSEIAYDKRLFELPAQILADEGLPMVDFPQSVERMTPACKEIYEAIMRREISHNGDELYKRQILNAKPRLGEHGFTLEKRKSRGKIDAAIALTLMHARAQRPAPQKAPAFVL